MGLLWRRKQFAVEVKWIDPMQKLQSRRSLKKAMENYQYEANCYWITGTYNKVKCDSSEKVKVKCDSSEKVKSVEKPQTQISVLVDSKKKANIKENRHILKSVAESVLYCGRQCIALRGTSEKQNSTGNPGNFLALMKLLANHDEKLKQHMERPKLRNATYLSPQTQNQMIDVIGKRIIQAQIVDEVKNAQIYTADKVTSHNVELMPLCVRFVDKDINIREELLEICSLPRITGSHIATAIKDVLSHLNIEIVVRNMIDKMKSTIIFFTYSPKREQLLMEVALEVIALGLHTEEYSQDVTTGWQGKYKAEAYSLLSGLQNFGFILTFLTASQTSVDIMEAFSMVDEVKNIYKELRETIEDDFNQIYKQAIRMAAQDDVQPTSQPRVAGRQTHRENVPAETVKDYYRRNMAIPFLDHDLGGNSGMTVDISEVVQLYQDDLPSPELIDQELKCWTLKWQNKPSEQRPTSCAEAIKQCDALIYPNIFKLLKIASTLPVTSCECERSASTLRRLNTFMRSSMGEDRLSSLALIHTHYDMAVNLDEAVNIFSKLHPRRLELTSVLNP
ncbi:unnamed protein product [Leuciscus chuanchicus]